MCSGCRMKVRDVFKFDRVCIMDKYVITEIEMCSGYQMKTRDVCEFDRIYFVGGGGGGGASLQKSTCVLGTK